MKNNDLTELEKFVHDAVQVIHNSPGQPRYILFLQASGSPEVTIWSNIDRGKELKRILELIGRKVDTDENIELTKDNRH